jgi:hypothetical protein
MTNIHMVDFLHMQLIMYRWLISSLNPNFIDVVKVSSTQLVANI